MSIGLRGPGPPLASALGKYFTKILVFVQDGLGELWPLCPPLATPLDSWDFSKWLENKLLKFKAS